MMVYLDGIPIKELRAEFPSKCAEEMSIEQAVEVILKGKPWKECSKCLGCGIYFHDITHTEQGWHMKQGDCAQCSGKGHIVRPIYMAALDVLRMCPPTEAPPKIARSVTVTFNGENSYR